MMDTSYKSPKPAYTGPRYTLLHPELGELRGRLIESSHFPHHPVVQFRSIPYATIPERFQPSILLNSIPPSFDKRPHRDFTNFGAACPQVAPKQPDWFDAYGGPLEDDLGIEFDEDTCLTVTISAPQSHLDTSSSSPEKLPVMVYIHGGGSQEGVGHVDGCHSNAPLASYAASISQPVVTVNVGYRLNWLGNLVCRDLLDEFAASPSSPHGPFNLTLQDQRQAFKWMHRFIEGFGGDSKNITAFGESAGSVQLAYHICGSPTRLFDRAILQSGLVFGNLPLETKDKEYHALLESLNIKGETAAERLAALRQVDVDTLVMCTGSHMFPYIDPIPNVRLQDSLFSRGRPTPMSQAELIATCEWLGDLVIGEDFWEGQVFLPLVKASSQPMFLEAVKSLFPTQEAHALLSTYDLPILGSIDDNRAMMQISLFYGDMMLSSQYHTLARVLAAHAGEGKRKVYRYSFALSNPFPGSYCSFSPGHHFVEILFIFLTFLDRYPTRRNHWAARQAKETARRWITFANGREPWDPYFDQPLTGERNARIAVCDDLRGWTVRTLSEDEQISKEDPWGERRYAGWRAFEAAFDALKVAGDDESVHNHKATMVKLQILKVIYSSVGMVQVP